LWQLVFSWLLVQIAIILVALLIFSCSVELFTRAINCLRF